MRITPETRIGALLEAHPELEEALIAFSPVFEKLKNPVLRRTVAKVATLEQAARMSGAPLLQLMTKLQYMLGSTEPVPGSIAKPDESRPVWADPAAITLELDATRLLAAGEHPLGRLRRELNQNPPGAVLALWADFEPAPLLDQFRSEGAMVWCGAEQGRFRTYLRRA